MKIKDGRKRGWFWGQNEIFDTWGKYLKPNGIAVYLCLCRHANQDYETWPGYGMIGDECGMSRRTAIRTIKQLINFGLVTCTPREKKDGSDNSNLYTILDISKVTLPSPKKPSHKKNITKSDGSVTESLGGSDTQTLPLVTHRHYPSDTQTLPLVTHRHYPSDTQTPKGNSIKETNFKETNLRISPYSPPKGDTSTAEEKKDSTKKKSKEDDHQAKEVIDYLNRATGRQFKHAASHLRHVEARFKEGFTTNELKLVVNFKARQWIDDPKMSQYLRPSTLFGTKADDYLQAAIQAGGNLEDPEAIVGNANTNNSIENSTKNGDHYAKNQPNYQPGRVPKTPWEKTAATIERVFGSTNTTLDPDGKPVNPLFRNPDDYAF